MTTDASAGTTSKRHLLHVFPTFAVGGAQRQFVELGLRLAPSYRHTIIALDGNFDMASGLSNRIDFELADAEHVKSRHLLNIPGFRRRIERCAPDVLVTYNWGAIEWALADRWAPLARHIHIEDGFGPDEAAGQLARRVWTRRIALSGAHTKVVVPSHRLLEIARGEWRLPATVLIPNGVDCTRFAPRERNNNGADRIVVGTVAALRPEKNIARLIRAFADVVAATRRSDIRLLIVGDGPERRDLESLAQDLGLAQRVEFRGATPTPEAALGEMDVFALSSDTEQMPLSILEAMASGLPVAAVAVGDVSRMLAQENRPFVAPLGEPSGLATAIQTLAENASLREQLGRANRRAALELYDIDLMSDRYAALFG